jgi:hypothetical protein
LQELIEDQGELRGTPETLPPVDYLPPDEPDHEISRRLTEAFHRAMEWSATPDGLWAGIADRCHGELAKALRERDHSQVSRVLGRMFIHPVTTGLALGEGTYLACKSSPRDVSLDWHRKALSLAVGCGVLPAQTPEQGSQIHVSDLDSIAVLQRVGDFLGIDVAPPQVGALFGVRVRDGIVPVNHLLHLYTGHRLATLLRPAGSCCLEIGGGVGLLAYTAVLLGIRRYCILDLPLVRVAPLVRLLGEDEPSSGPVVRILPAWYLDRLASKSFDVVVNQDSMPEMALPTMQAYLDAIPRLSRRWFLSINQEAQAGSSPGSRQGWVHRACRGRAAMHSLYRAPYWVRKGYVEEVYSIQDQDGQTTT